MSGRVCLRCDWTGDVPGGCPRCGTALYRWPEPDERPGPPSIEGSPQAPKLPAHGGRSKAGVLVSVAVAVVVGLLLIDDSLTPSGATGQRVETRPTASSPDPGCVGPDPCPPRERYQAEVAAICKAANERARVALDDRLTPGSRIEDPANLTAADVEILRVMNGIVLRRSVAVLADLRTLHRPEADRARLEQDFALREREIAVLRSIVSAATAGDVARVQTLHDRQIDLVGRRALDVPGHLPETCLISFGA